jgi:hypothetical protein
MDDGQGTVLTDSSGNGLHGAFQGAPVWQDTDGGPDGGPGVTLGV